MRKCVEKKVIPEEEAEKLSEEEKLTLMFRAGISTATEISDINDNTKSAVDMIRGIAGAVEDVSLASDVAMNAINEFIPTLTRINDNLQSLSGCIVQAQTRFPGANHTSELAGYMEKLGRELSAISEMARSAGNPRCG